MLALNSADAMFYYRAAVTWLLCATVVLAIVRGWIGGHGFRTKKRNLLALFWSSLIAKENLRLRIAVVPGNIAAEMSGGGGREAIGVLVVVEHVLTDGALIWVLLRVAAICVLAVGVLAIFHAVWVAMGEAISWRRSPARPRVAGKRGVGRWSARYRLVVEIVLFLSSFVSCVHEVPLVVLHYMNAATQVQECCWNIVAVPCV